MPNVAPTVTPLNRNLFINAFVKASDLFTASDADEGDSITRYRFMDFDDRSISGRFELNGQLQFNGATIEIAASDLANLFYIGGSAVSNESIKIQAFDGEVWSDPTVVAQAYTTRQNITRPVATVTARTLLGNEFVQAESFISASDPDGFPILRYMIRDRFENNSFLRLGDTRLDAGRYHTIEADQMADLRYYGFGRPSDLIDVFAFDGSQWSDFASARITTRLNENRPSLQFGRFIAPSRTTLSLVDKFAVTDADGNSTKRYRLIDTSPHAFSGFLTRDGVPLEAKQWHEFLARDLDRYRYTGAERTFNEQIRAQVYDGRFWSTVETVIFETVVPPQIGGPSNLVESHLENTPFGGSVPDPFDPFGESSPPLVFQSDDGPGFQSYQMVDMNTEAISGSLYLNGLRQAAGTIHEFSIGQVVNDLDFRTGSYEDRSLDQVLMRSYNGTYFSEWKRLNVYTEPEYIKSTQSTSDWFNQPEIVQAGGKLQISYSFMQEFPDYETGEAVDEPDNDPPRPFSTFTNDQRVATRRMFRDVESFLNVEFIEVSDTQTQFQTGYRGGVMRFGNYTLEGPPPDGPSSASAFAFFPGGAAQSGDQWFNLFYNPDRGPAWDYGGGSYSTMIHELGHAMGLNHTFAPPGEPQKPALPPTTDSDQYSVMSYSGAPTGIIPWGFQLYDVANLQRVYGSVQNNTGDDVYSIDRFGTDNFVSTIWDTGGTDTFSAEGSIRDSIIDLRAGRFNSIGNRGNNMVAAFEVEIENGIGSDNNDLVFGNELANTLTGGGGNDFLQGFGGDDILIGGAGNDVFEYGLADGNDSINENRGAGVDTLRISDFPTLDDFTTDLTFRREGRNLLVDLTIDNGPSQGTLTIQNQQWGAFRIETIEVGGLDVDLRELFEQTAAGGTQFRVLSESTTFGFLTVPV